MCGRMRYFCRAYLFRRDSLLIRGIGLGGTFWRKMIVDGSNSMIIVPGNLKLNSMTLNSSTMIFLK